MGDMDFYLFIIWIARKTTTFNNFAFRVSIANEKPPVNVGIIIKW